MLPRRPMRLRLVKEPFDHPDYIFELNMDGFRAMVYIRDRECKLISRNLKNLPFQSLKSALAKLPVQSAILDGEIVCLDKNGVSQFYQLLAGKGEPIYYAFDLLWLDGEDLRKSAADRAQETACEAGEVERLQTAALRGAHRA